MESIRRTRQPDLFMSLKKDLVMVSCSSPTQVFKISFIYLFIFILFLLFFICRVDRIFNHTYYLYAGHSAGLCGRGLGVKCK